MRRTQLDQRMGSQKNQSLMADKIRGEKMRAADEVKQLKGHLRNEMNSIRSTEGTINSERQRKV